MRWYGHVLRRDECDVLRRALDFQVEGKRRRGHPKAMWKSQVEEESRRIGLTKEDALERKKWRRGVKNIAAR